VVNLLDYSTVGGGGKSIDIKDGSYVPTSDLDQLCCDGYDAELYAGAPVACTGRGTQTSGGEDLDLCFYLVQELKI
jgi:hypothetical protein